MPDSRDAQRQLFGERGDRLDRRTDDRREVDAGLRRRLPRSWALDGGIVLALPIACVAAILGSILLSPRPRRDPGFRSVEFVIVADLRSGDRRRFEHIRRGARGGPHSRAAR
jgi:hypothetical protein